MPATKPKDDEPDVVTPDDWVNRHADSLFRYARSRLPGEHDAHDVVQETLIAGWRARRTMQDGAPPSAAWLKSVLRNKLADHYRRFYRERGAGDTQAVMGTSADYEKSGHWDDDHAPKRWIEPSENDSRGKIELRETLDLCIGKLPPSHARIFLMREAECLDTPVILELTGISESNLFVMLHRARLALRRCLEDNHFSAKGLTR